MKAKWLYSKHPIVIDTDLAVVLGSNGDREAIVLQQLNYWLHSNIAKKIDGRMWIYNTFENWQKDNFPWLSVRTVRRIFTNLEEKGLILTGNFNKAGFDKTKWYSIDEDALNDLMSNACGQNGHSIVTKCPHGDGQNDHTYTRDYTETTTENTSHHHLDDDENHILFKQLLDSYQKLTGCKFTKAERQSVISNYMDRLPAETVKEVINNAIAAPDKNNSIAYLFKCLDNAVKAGGEQYG